MTTGYLFPTGVTSGTIVEQYSHTYACDNDFATIARVGGDGILTFQFTEASTIQQYLANKYGGVASNYSISAMRIKVRLDLDNFATGYWYEDEERNIHWAGDYTLIYYSRGDGTDSHRFFNDQGYGYGNNPGLDLTGVTVNNQQTYAGYTEYIINVNYSSYSQSPPKIKFVFSGGSVVPTDMRFIYDVFLEVDYTTNHYYTKVYNSPPTTTTPRMVVADDRWNSNSGVFEPPTTTVAATYAYDYQLVKPDLGNPDGWYWVTLGIPYLGSIV